MPRDKTQWVRVTRARPCPICAKPQWCRVSADGAVVHCCRVESPHPWPGPAGGWVHKLTDSLAPPPPVRRPSPSKPPAPINWGAVAQVCFQDPGAAQVRAALAGSLWSSVSSLEALGVGSGLDEFRDLPYSTWPCRNHLGAVVGILRRYADGTKRHALGSQTGLFYAPNRWPGEGPICVPEGASDVAILLDLGLPAVGRPQNVCRSQLHELLAPWRHRPMIVLAERDWRLVEDGPPHDLHCTGCLRCWPGLAGAQITADYLAENLDRPVQWQFAGNYKDVRDWRRDHVLASATAFLAALTCDTH